MEVRDKSHCELAVHNRAYLRQEGHSLTHCLNGERNLANGTRFEMLQNLLKAAIHAELVDYLRDAA